MEATSQQLVALLIMSIIVPTGAFDTLSDVIAYTQTHDKYPDSDLTISGQVEGIHPDFSTFYRTIAPGWFERLRCYLNIARPLWCFEDFVQTIHTLYAQGRARSWNKALVAKQSIVGMVIGHTHQAPSRFIVVGELSGSLHSIAAIIQHWHETGIIDEQFRLKDQQNTVIFLGDIVGSSAYDLETLTLVGTIAHRNPDQVHILCGRAEDRQRWREVPLYKGIELRSRLNRDDLRTIYALVDDNFALLPDAFVLTTHDKSSAIVFSASTVFNSIILEELLACLPDVSSPKLHGCPLYGHSTTMTQHNTLLALVETRRTWNTIYPTPPLEKSQLPAIKGTVWDLISGTPRATRSIYRIRWDGYLVIKPQGEQLENTTLEYIGRRVDFDDIFQTRAVYNLITGQPLEHLPA